MTCLHSDEGKETILALGARKTCFCDKIPQAQSSPNTSEHSSLGPGLTAYITGESGGCLARLKGEINSFWKGCLPTGAKCSNNVKTGGTLFHE